MFGKYLLIALVYVSVAQVHGDEMEDVIFNGLTRAKVIDEKLKNTLYDSARDVYDKMWLIEINTHNYVEKAREVQTTSRRTLRSVAIATEEKARQNDRPNSVFECIRRNEEKGNREIETLTNKFQSDVERLYGTKREEMRIAYKPFNSYEPRIDDGFHKAVADITNCQTPGCVTTALNNYATFAKSMSSEMRRVQGQIATIWTNFRRDANNYYTNSNRQINRIKSTAIRNIKLCYYNGRKFFEDFEATEEL